MARGIEKYGIETAMGLGRFSQLNAFLLTSAANGTDFARMYPALASDVMNRGQIYTVTDLAVCCQTAAGGGSTATIEFHRTNQAGSDLGIIGSIVLGPTVKYVALDVRQSFQGVKLLPGQGIRIDITGQAGAGNATNINLCVNGAAFGISS